MLPLFPNVPSAFPAFQCEPNNDGKRRARLAQAIAAMTATHSTHLCRNYRVNARIVAKEWNELTDPTAHYSSHYPATASCSPRYWIE